MSLLLALLFGLAAVAGLGVVRSRDPRRQALAMAANGLVLALLFFALQAPDVALSELVVGTAATPLLFLAALAAVRINLEDSPKSGSGPAPETAPKAGPERGPS